MSQLFFAPRCYALVATALLANCLRAAEVAVSPAAESALRTDRSEASERADVAVPPVSRVESTRVDRSVAAKSLATASTLGATDQKPTMLNGTLVSQWVMLGPDGVLRGRVAGLARIEELTDPPQTTEPIKPQARILLFSGRGSLQTITNADGAFEIRNCPPGSYGLLVIGRQSFAAVSLHVLPRSSDEHVEAGPLSEADDSPSTTGVAIARSLTIYPVAIENSQLQKLVSQAAPDSPSTPYAWEEFQTDPLGKQRFTAGASTVFAQRDGSVEGRLALPPQADGSAPFLDGMNLWIFRDGMTVTQAPVAADGTFKIVGLSPGEYGLLTVGRSGIAAASFELAPNLATLPRSGRMRYVSFTSSPDILPTPGLRLEIIPATTPEFHHICCQPFESFSDLELALDELPCDPCASACVTSCCETMGWGGGGGGGLYSSTPFPWAAAGLLGFIPGGGGEGSIPPPVIPIPEPGSLVLCGLLAAGVGLRRLRRPRLQAAREVPCVPSTDG
jgi:hypothetical protein